MATPTLPSSSDIFKLDAHELSALYKAKKLSPVEVTNSILTRIEKLQPQFNAYRYIDNVGALANAKASELRWGQGKPLSRLDGIPAAIKDLLHVSGWPTRKGSLATSPACVAEDSPVAARLREGGAVLLGKTQTAEFGWKGLTETKLGGITHNAWNPDYASSGSSGGAAVAAALGLGAIQIGTDGGGSIRAPAAVNGVFGFKPSYGRVAGYPSALNGNLFHIGPLTRSVRDAALIFNTIAAPDVRDWTSLPRDGRDWSLELDNLKLNLRGLRIAFSPTLYRTQVHSDIAAAVKKAAAVFAQQRAIVEEIFINVEDPSPILSVFASERSARLIRDIGEKGLEVIDPDIRASVQRAQSYSISDLVDAQEKRAALAVYFRKFHQNYDLLITPIQSQPVPKLGIAPQVPFLSVFNLTQQPAASLPVGFDSNGLPIGLQIVGPYLSDALVLRAARAFELVKPFTRVSV